MSQYHVLRETPDDSGNWVEIEVLSDDTTRDQAFDHAAALSASGGRFAIYEYNSLRMAQPEVATKVGDLITDGQEHTAAIEGDHPAAPTEREAVLEPIPEPEPRPAHEAAPEPGQDASEHPTS